MDLPSREFIEQMVADNPEPLNGIGEFVYYRTYSRCFPDKDSLGIWRK